MGEPARIAGQPRRPAVAVELDRSLATPARFLVEGRIAALIGLSRGVRSVREQFLGRRSPRAVRTQQAERSDSRRVGTEGVSTWRACVAPCHYKTNNNITTNIARTY